MVAAEANARELLGTLGYFTPTLTLELKETPIAGAKAPREVVITVDPGEVTHVSSVQIGFAGPIENDPTSQAQRDADLKDGYLAIERAISREWLTKLRAAADGFVVQSRKVTKADKVFDIERGHTAENPRLRRVSSPQDQHPVFWELCANSVLPDIVQYCE